jgi:hypothetical protein
MPLKPVVIRTDMGAGSASLPDPPLPRPDRSPAQLEAMRRPPTDVPFSQNNNPVTSAPGRVEEYVPRAMNPPAVVTPAESLARNRQRGWEPDKTAGE